MVLNALPISTVFRPAGEVRCGGGPKEKPSSGSGTPTGLQCTTPYSGTSRGSCDHHSPVGATRKRTATCNLKQKRQLIRMWVMYRAGNGKVSALQQDGGRSSRDSSGVAVDAAID